MVQVNPDPNRDGFQFNPVERVTGLFLEGTAARAAVDALRAAGLPQGGIEVYCGEEGMRRINASGEEGGMAARLFRRIESWVSDTSDAHVHAEQHLAAGGYVVAAHVGEDDALKTRAMEALTGAGGTEVKYWHRLYVEQDTRSNR